MSSSLAAADAPGPAFDADLIAKYDGFGPRYTSYPTADRFTEAIGGDAIGRALMARRDAKSVDLSLYVNLPFCSNICTTRAQKVITRTRPIAKNTFPPGRWTWCGAIRPRLAVRKLHWGGGPPVHLGRELASDGTSAGFDSRRTPNVRSRSIAQRRQTHRRIAWLGFKA